VGGAVTAEATASAVAAPAFARVDAGHADLSPYVADIHATWLADDPGGALSQRVDGTLVFADISGFTPLTERLAREGKVGAEKLTDVLNEVFANLMSVAGALGGDLLKYGGDALLLLFSGRNHERQGPAAALEMRRALAAHVRRARGELRLRMSVGVNSGAFDLFLVGASHRELIVAGPATSATCAFESAADPGEILVGPATAEALGPGSLGAAKAGGHLLRRARLEGVHLVERAPAAANVAQGVPVSLRSHLGRLPDGEHRVVHVAFVQFKGLDAVIERDGRRAAADALHSLVTTAERACDRHRLTFLCTDVDRDGGKLVLAAGAPTAGDDDGDRLLLGVRDVLAVDHGLAVRAGANRGRLFALDIGRRGRRSYTVMGDGMNLAARVMGRAEPGQLVATRALLDRLRARFELRQLEPFTVKGKSQPVDAAVVGPPSGAQRATSSLSIDLVGRDAELATLREMVDLARHGRGRVVALVGEAGIGKSRLLGEVVAHADGLPVLAVEGAQFATAHPYFAVRSAFRSLLGRTRDEPDGDVAGDLAALVERHVPHLAPWLPFLALPFGVDLPDTPETAGVHPGFRRRRVHAVVTELLDAMLAGPTLVTVEDGHWLDDASAELLRHLFGLVDDHPWAVCVTRRPTPGGLVLTPSDNVTVLDVGALTVDASRAFVVRATEEHPLPPDVVDALASRSGGNPLFLQELVAAAREGAGVDELPETIEALIACRIDVLGPDDRELLRCASVFGQRFEAVWLAAIADRRDDIGDALADLTEFVEAETATRWRFRHALLREGAYEGLSYRRRRELHAKAGEEIEARAGAGADAWADVLSLHFLRAGRHAAAWNYARVAADRARHGAANVEAATLYARALDAVRRVPDAPAGEVAAVAEAMGDVCDLAARYGEAAAAYRQARRLRAGDDLALVSLLQKEGWLRERTGRYSLGWRWYQRALATLDEAREAADSLEVGRLRAQLTLACGATRLRQGRYRECLPFLEEAAGRARTLGDRKTEAHCYYLLYWVYSDLGDPAAERYRLLPLPIYEELGDHFGRGNVLNNLGMQAHIEGRWAEALDLLRRSREERELAGDVVQVGTTANNIAEVLLDQGHLDDAHRLLDEARRLWVATAYPVGIGVAKYNLARIATRRGEFAAARSLLAESRDTLDAIEAHHLAATARLWELERLVAAGEAADAIVAGDALSAQLARLADVPLHIRSALARLSGWALAQSGDFEAARARFDDALAAASARHADFEVALTRDALAAVGTVAGWRGVARWRAAAAETFARLEVVSTLSFPLKRPAVSATA
jgi:class 3 adenylate cyclase/tetratricopeptide (TPR) repeat protein